LDQQILQVCRNRGVNLIFDVGAIDKNVPEEEFLEEKIKKVNEILAIFLGKNNSTKKISDKEIFKILKDIKITFPKEGIPRVEKNLRKSYTEEDYFEIYSEMLDKKDSKQYEELSNIHGCSIQNLIDILDKLRLFKIKLESINLKQADFEYRKIFKEYALMNHADYGIDNPQLKTRINKARSQKGSYHKLISKKNEIFLNILLERCKAQGKWSNPAYAVKSNMELIFNKFKEFDIAWINKDIVENTNRINNLSILVKDIENGVRDRGKYSSELSKLKLRNEKLNSALNDGYPFYNLEKILPYNTPDVENILIKSLRKEIFILDKIISKN